MILETQPAHDTPAACGSSATGPTPRQQHKQAEGGEAFNFEPGSAEILQRIWLTGQARCGMDDKGG